MESLENRDDGDANDDTAIAVDTGDEYGAALSESYSVQVKRWLHYI